jgi:hypothetical protein
MVIIPEPHLKSESMTSEAVTPEAAVSKRVTMKMQLIWVIFISLDLPSTSYEIQKIVNLVRDQTLS